MRLTDLISTMVSGALEGVHTALPARVERFDAATLRGEVVPLVKARVESGKEPEALPLILDVPFLMPKAGPIVFRLPVAKGDVVLVVFSERALDHILTGNTPRDPKIKRRHALDDAVAIPGLLHGGEGELPGEHADDALLLNRDNDSKIVLQADGEVLLDVAPHRVRLVPGGAAILESPDLRLGGEGAGEGVPLGDQLKSWLDGHTHPFQYTDMGAPVPGLTGPPALDPLGVIPDPSPGPSGKVKVE